MQALDMEGVANIWHPDYGIDYGTRQEVKDDRKVTVGYCGRCDWRSNPQTGWHTAANYRAEKRAGQHFEQEHTGDT